MWNKRVVICCSLEEYWAEIICINFNCDSSLKRAAIKITDEAAPLFVPSDARRVTCLVDQTRMINCFFNYLIVKPNVTQVGKVILLTISWTL